MRSGQRSWASQTLMWQPLTSQLGIMSPPHSLLMQVSPPIIPSQGFGMKEIQQRAVYGSVDQSACIQDVCAHDVENEMLVQI